MKAQAEERAYREIKRAIIEHRLGPNTQLVETVLAAELGISRTPVRGALRRLAHEGFVDLRPNRGAYVAQPTAREIEEVFEVRCELEGLCARLAARRIGPEDLARLRRLNAAELECYRARNLWQFIHTNGDIHRTVARAGGNETAAHLAEGMISRSDVYLVFYDTFHHAPLDQVRSVDEHRRIIDALEDGDGDLAERRVREHLQSSFDNLNLVSLRLQGEDGLSLTGGGDRQ